MSVCQARVESLLMGRQRMLYTRETRNGLWDSVARLENPRIRIHEKMSVAPRLCACPSLLYVTQPIVASEHKCQADVPH